MGYTVNAIQTGVFQPKQDLLEFLIQNLPRRFPENSILAITSKILSLAENRIVLKTSIDKKELIQKEADIYLGQLGYGTHLTIKEGLLIPASGIDESNANGDFYILYPENPFESAFKIWAALRSHYKIKQLGILITDSHTMALRKGVIGISLSHWGFEGVRNLIGAADLFGRPMKMTQVNIADALAAAAVLSMGEADESKPLALIEGADVKFTDRGQAGECSVPLKEDLYFPLLKAFCDSVDSEL